MDETTAKELAEAVDSAHLVAHPGPHVYWGSRELALFTGLGVKGLRDMLALPDFPQPAEESADLRIGIRADMT